MLLLYSLIVSPCRSGDTAGTMSVASTLTRPRSEPASNTNTLNTITRSNPAYRDETQADLYAAQYPNNSTLPIQRPLYQPV